MLAIKANKQYKVDEVSKSRYLADGYDIVDDKGNVIERSPKSTVPYEEYAKVEKELIELKASMAAGDTSEGKESKPGDEKTSKAKPKTDKS